MRKPSLIIQKSRVPKPALAICGWWVPKRPAFCLGRQATMVGTSGPDSIRGTDGPDVIMGLGGDDAITGGRGDDVICAGPNRASLERRWLVGIDFAQGGPGDDVIAGGPGVDRLYGNRGDDRIYGGRNRSFSYVYAGERHVAGEVLHDDVGNNRLVGGLGADRLTGPVPPNHLDGGPGSD